MLIGLVHKIDHFDRGRGEDNVGMRNEKARIEFDPLMHLCSSLILHGPLQAAAAAAVVQKIQNGFNVSQPHRFELSTLGVALKAGL